MTDLFSPAEFDDWADRYDRDVNGDNAFPFDGYPFLLETIAALANTQPGDRVLDLGIGTGNLAELFAKQGCELWGLDFSNEMLKLARVKLPQAHLVQADLRASWPDELPQRFDRIVSAYTFHHFPLEEKVAMVTSLLSEHLSPRGQVIIGDIAFRDVGEEDALRSALGAEWEQEYYWLADRELSAFEAVGVTARFTKISSCAGVFVFEWLT